MGKYLILSKDPAIQTLYDQISRHWPVAVKSRNNRKSREQVDAGDGDAETLDYGAGADEVVDDGFQDGNDQCETDAYDL